MKTSHRFLLGMLSSILFAIGMVRAAEQLDPVARAQADSDLDTTLTGNAFCTSDCNDGDPS
jgi:hypothetical protein